MSEIDRFDRRLSEALREYAAEAPVDIDAVGLARSVAHAAGGRSSFVAAVAEVVRPAFRTAFMLVLLLLAALAVAAVGSALLSNDGVRVPRDLAGVWEAEVPESGLDVPADRYRLDFSADILVTRMDGAPVAWIGHVTDITMTSTGIWDVVVEGTDRCATARYVLHLPRIREDEPSQDESLEFHAPAGECRDRAAILSSVTWKRPESVQLVAGRTYRTPEFTEPFTFVAPATSPLPVMGRWGSPGGLRFGMGCCWDSWFLDDQPVNVDVCDVSEGMLPDIPATPDAVGAWLRTSESLVVSDPISVPVDGRIALRFDIESYDVERSGSPDCFGFHAPLTPPEVITGFRYYAIPTRDDVILYVVWSDPGSYPSVESGAESLVRSIDFTE